MTTVKQDNQRVGIKLYRLILTEKGEFMKKMLIMGMAFCFACALFACATPKPKQAISKPSQKKVQRKTAFVTIGTGGITGLYYPTGGAIAKMVNKKRKEYGIRCTVESTDGSVFNINGVMSGELEFGIAQSDRQYQAIKGLAEWKNTPQRNLRSVFSIHSESVSLIASYISGVKGIGDLKGKQVNIGSPHSGQHQNSIDALTAVGLDYEKDIKAKEVKAFQAPELIKNGSIDAFFYTVGHPNAAFREAVSGDTKMLLVPVSGPGIERLIRENPYYTKSVIPVKKLYPAAANGEDMINTFGVKATLITSAKVPNNVVYAITKEIFENLVPFRKLHPVYEVLTRKGMLEGLSAPIHPGAMKYYKEVGLI